MDDEDDFSGGSPPSPPPLPPSRRISVTVATAPPSQQSLTLALPTQNPRFQTPGTAISLSGGGGREDAWSEAATAVLIDAWGERYLELSRGNLKQQHWREVAEEVNRSEVELGKQPKTDIQCKNRIDTVKKKYKLEKSKIAGGGGGTSKWVFYDRLDYLIGGGSKGGGSGIPVGIPVRAGGRPGPVMLSRKSRPLVTSRRRPPPESESEESEPEPPTPDSADSFLAYKRPRVEPVRPRENVVVPPRENSGPRENVEKDESNWGSSVRGLTKAILRFGETYERAESAMLQQMVELEKQRMKFTKEIELQRMEFFMKTQMEISQMKHRRGGGGGSSNNHNNRHRRHQQQHQHCSNNNVDNNHSDSNS